MLKTGRIAVIGAGAAGLCALRRILSSASHWDVVCYEASPVIGGTWVYSDAVPSLKIPHHSSMYRNLKTNLPKEVMAFPGFPFPDHLSSFMSHEDVLGYLQRFSSHYQLNEVIQFNTKVTNISPIDKSKESTRWLVTTRSCLDPSAVENTELFDAVFVCNGHYTLPLWPNLQGLDKCQKVVTPADSDCNVSSPFPLVTHSHYYRHPEVYQDLRVVVLGAASSGTDIALDISPFAKEVILSHWKQPLTSPLPDNIKQAGAICSITPEGVDFTPLTSLKPKHDDTVDTVNAFHNPITGPYSADIIVLCTGYRYDFPFLSKECDFTIDRNIERLPDVYRHLIHCKFPTLFFIGVTKVICPFPQFDCQVLYCLSVLSGATKLPSVPERRKHTEDDFKWRKQSLKLPPRKAHTMGTLQWDYNDELSKLAGTVPIPRVVQRLYDYVHEWRVKDLPNYKKNNFEVKGGDFEQV